MHEIDARTYANGVARLLINDEVVIEWTPTGEAAETYPVPTSTTNAPWDWFEGEHGALGQEVRPVG
jgi:hypothetical protein